MSESGPSTIDFDMKMRLATDRVLRVVTLRRQAMVAVLASAALSVVAAARPDLLPNDLLALKNILNVGAISALLNDVAGGKEPDDDKLAARMEALLPTHDAMDRLAMGQDDLLRALTRQQTWLRQIKVLGETNVGETAKLIEYVINITGDLYTIRQQLISIESRHDQGILIQNALDQMGAHFIDIPIVVVAMTASQAHSLVGNGVKSTYKRSSILSMYKKYAKLGDEEWIGHYRSTPDEWIPFFPPHKSLTSIWELVIDLIAGMNAKREPGDNIFLQPRTFSNDFFDPVRQSNANLELLSKGGILIIDPISLNHSGILDTLKNSAILGNPNISTVVVNPLDLSSISMHTHLMTLVESNLLAFQRRFADGLDYRCEYSGGDLVYLRRWLFQQIKVYKFDSHKRIMSPDKRDGFYLREKIDRNPQGSKFADVIRQQ